MNAMGMVSFESPRAIEGGLAWLFLQGIADENVPSLEYDATVCFPDRR
jgi:hypothetical protein